MDISTGIDAKIGYVTVLMPGGYQYVSSKMKYFLVLRIMNSQIELHCTNTCSNRIVSKILLHLKVSKLRYNSRARQSKF